MITVWGGVPDDELEAMYDEMITNALVEEEMFQELDTFASTATERLNMTFQMKNRLK